MEEFLRKTRVALKEGLTNKVHIVLGNEACDLDSAAAAITYAYYLDSVCNKEGTVTIPVLNIPSADFRLRTEVTYYFEKVHIPLDNLTFRDQIDLKDLHRTKRLILTLVDHNVLPEGDKELDDAVVEVIDHHQRDRPPNDKESVTVEMVGSCCTLVAEKLTTDEKFQFDPQISELLYGVVLLDTVNLLEEAGRTTPKDVLIVDFLEGYRANDVPSRQVVFSGIEKAKADVSGLTLVELLRKDMKVLSFPNNRVVFSSIPLHMEEYLSKDDAQASLLSFSEQQQTAVIVIMALSLTELGVPERQIAVFSKDSQLRAQCVDLLQSSREPDLDLSPMTSNWDLITAFEQGNVTASRKKVLPYIKANASKMKEVSPGESKNMISPSQDSGLALDSPSDPSGSVKTTATESPSEVRDPFENVTSPQQVGEISEENATAQLATATAKVSKSEELADVEVEEEEELSDSQPASTRPGGLLDLDFFEPPAGDHTSEAGSLGSLDDYAEEQDIELVPAHSHGKMLELISDALEETDMPKKTAKGEAQLLSVETLKRPESETDLFEHHEGVLMGPSPPHGTTPDFNLTPDTSQPTSPPNTSYPSTPPNSYIDPSAMEGMKGHQTLPSFMNADMVRRIQEKKAALSVIDEDNLKEDKAYPFTPQNSVSNSLATQSNWERGLPTLGNVEMIEAVHNKRKEFPDFEPQTTSEALKFPYTPPNSFVDGSFMQQGGKKSPLNLMEEDVAARLSSKMAKRFDDLEEDEEREKAEEKGDQEDIAKLVNPEDGNVVAFRIAQEMNAQKPSDETDSNPATAAPDDEDIQKKVNPVDGNAVAFRIAQEMRAEKEAADCELDTDLSEDILQESLTTGVPKSDTMELLANTDSLQAELAQAEGKEPTVDLTEDSTDSKTPTPKNGSSADKTPLDDASSAKPSSTVKFTLPETGDDDLKERLKQSDPRGRPPSGSQVSEASTDSDLSQGMQEFLSRMRTDTGASAISGNSDYLLETQNLEVARKIVEEAISSAVDVVKEDSPEKEDLMRAGEWDSAKMNKIHEAPVLDTTSSTSKEVDEMNSNTLTQRPLTLESTPKKKILPNLDLLRDDQDDSILANASVSSSEGEALDSFNDLQTPDDLTTPEAFGDSVFEGELDWEESENSDETPSVEPIPEYTAKEEFEDEKNWRTVTVGDRQFRIDMKVIEPYKKVLSHGGYYGDGFNAIIVFAGCYLPDKRRRDYHYVMDNLFLYVLSTLELLVVEDYMVVYFHGATPKHKMPSLRWLKRCYDMIDRRLRKNLKSLLIVHPTLWIRTIMTLTKPFISSKFSSKLRYIRSLKDLEQAVPMEYIFVPDEIKMFDAVKFRQNPPSPTAT